VGTVDIRHSNVYAVAENVSSVYLSVGGTSNRTQLLQSGEGIGLLRLTAGVAVGLTCTVVGGLPPPSVNMFLDGVNVTDQVRWPPTIPVNHSSHLL